MTIGDRIKRRRKAINMSQVELAKKVGTTKQNIYKYENGIIENIPSDKIEAIASALEVAPAYLMGWDIESIEQDIQETEALLKRETDEQKKSELEGSIDTLRKSSALWHDLARLDEPASDYDEDEGYAKVIEHKARTRDWLLNTLSHLYGKAEEKTYFNDNTGLSYFLISSGPEEQFILHESGFQAIIESLEGLIPALIESLKDKRTESEMLHETLTELERTVKLIGGRDGIYFLRDLKNEKKTD